MKKFYFLFIFLFLFSSISLVAAQPPFQESSQVTGLTIEFQKFEYLKIGQDFQVNIHVFNNTNGLRLGNDTVSCELHGFYANGSHAIATTLFYDDEDKDFYLDIPGSFFTGGKASYMFYCNSTDAGGFISGPLIINGAGFELMDSEAKFYYVMIFAVLLLFSMFLVLTIKTPFENEKVESNEGVAIIKVTKGKYVKLFSFWITYGLFLWFMTIIAGMARNYIMFEGLRTMIQNLYIYTMVLGKIFNFAIPLVFIWLMWNDIIINKIIKKDGKKFIRNFR